LRNIDLIVVGSIVVVDGSRVIIDDSRVIVEDSRADVDWCGFRSDVDISVVLLSVLV